MSFLIGKGAVEVVSIKQETRELDLIIYFQCKPEDLARSDVQEQIVQCTDYAMEYLKSEHFIPRDSRTWKQKIGIVSKE